MQKICKHVFFYLARGLCHSSVGQWAKKNSETPCRSMASNAHFGSLYWFFFVSSRHFETTQPYPSNEFPTILLNKCVFAESSWNCHLILWRKNFGDLINVFVWSLFFLDVVRGRGWEFPARLEFALGLTNNVRRPSALCTNTRRPPSKVLELSWQGIRWTVTV